MTKSVYFITITLISGLFVTSLAESPCNDSLFLILRTKDIDSLSQREYEYLTSKSTACDKYILNTKNLISDTSSNIGNIEDEKPKNNKLRLFLYSY